jgi:hypothetical protein
MFVVQTAQAKRTKKYAILMTIVLLMTGSPAALIAIFTLHWGILPKK